MVAADAVVGHQKVVVALTANGVNLLILGKIGRRWHLIPVEALYAGQNYFIAPIYLCFLSGCKSLAAHKGSVGAVVVAQGHIAVMLNTNFCVFAANFTGRVVDYDFVVGVAADGDYKHGCFVLVVSMNDFTVFYFFPGKGIISFCPGLMMLPFFRIAGFFF